MTMNLAARRHDSLAAHGRFRLRHLLGGMQLNEFNAHGSRWCRAQKGEDMFEHRHRLRLLAAWGRLAALAGLVLTVLLIAPGQARAAVCQSSGPVGGSYTVNVCFSAPADGSTAVGPTAVTATATVTGTNPGIRRMAFYVDGQDLLLDYQTPYTFTLPSQKFVDGTKTIAVEAWMRDGFIGSRASINVTFSNGNQSPPVNGNSFTPRSGTNPPAGQPFVVGATGDGAGGESSENDVTGLISSWNPNLFLYLGDVYENGTSTEFYNWYRPTGGNLSTNGYYGQFNSITDPTIGNHEYTNGEAPGYFDFWDNAPHYYSYNTHGWHLISLDANSAFNQTAPGTAQYQWLQNDLNANTQPCTIAYFHQPLYNIGQEGYSTYLSSFWSLFAQHGVDLVVNGHDHTYQRWTPLNDSGVASPTGVTELVAGAGGHALGTFVTSDSRLVATATQFGALRLELNSAGAAYQFDNTADAILDSGSVQCNSSATDTTSPSTPANLTAVGSYKTKIDLSWGQSTDNVGVTGYEIYRDGQPLVTVPPQTSYPDTSVLPGSTHTYKVRALDAHSNHSAFTNDATATTPTVAVLFHDGFESGDLSNWTSNSGLVVQQSQVFAGSWAAEATATGGAGAWAVKDLDQPQPSLYDVSRFKILSQSQNVNLMRFRNGLAAHTALATLFVSTTGKLGLRDDISGVATTSTTTVSSGAWHTAQVHVTVNGTSSSTEVWLDGNPVAGLTMSGIDLGLNPVGRVELGDTTTGRTFDVALDEVAYDTEFIGDLTPPTAATNLTATAHSGLEVDLSWTPGADDVGVTGYDVYRNGSLIASIPAGSSWADQTVSPLTAYTYKLVSKDAGGNVSGFSNQASATTGDIFTDDFESGTLSKWTTVAGLLAQMGTVDGGSWAAQATSDGTSGSSAQVQLDSTLNELYYRVRFKLLSHGPNSVSLLRFRTATNGAIASAFVASTGKLGYRNDTTGTTTMSSLTVTPGVWHEVQLHVLLNDPASQVDLWLDGVSAVSQSDGLGTSPIGRLESGDPSSGRTFDMAFDNVVADPMFIADAAAPSAPSGLQATTTTGHEIDLAWNPADDDVGVTGYRIYRDGATIGEVDGGTLAYADAGLNESTQYAYDVTAIDAAGHESRPSNVIHPTTADATKPTKPTGLTGTAVAGQNQINLSWTASSDNLGVTGYRIYRNGSASPVGTVSGTTTSYSDTTVAGSTQYTYTVTAVDAATNESDASDPVTVTSSDTIPPQPPTVTATAVSDTQINLAWSGASDNVGITAYRIFRNGSATALATVAGTVASYSDTGLAGGTAYSYTVKAVDAAGNVSNASNSASATTTVFIDGFESGNLTKWTTVNGLAVQTSNVYAGRYAAESQGKNVVDMVTKQLPSTYTSLYYRLRLKIMQGKPDTIDVLRLRTVSGTNLLSIFYDSNKHLGYRNDTRSQATTSTTSLSTGVWYEVKVRLVVNGASSQVQVWLNGTLISALSRTDNFGTTPIGQVVAGESSTGHQYDFAVDEVRVDTNP
jgi:fibronectin type 3 domain-containing protein